MKRKSLILRVWAGEDGVIHGQVSDPFSEWRQTFQNRVELWEVITLFLEEMPVAPPPDQRQSDAR